MSFKANLYYWFSVGEATLPLHHLITQNTPAKPGIVHSLATAKLSRYHENKKVAIAEANCVCQLLTSGDMPFPTSLLIDPHRLISF
jgi:hypothetical protein